MAAGGLNKNHYAAEGLNVVLQPILTLVEPFDALTEAEDLLLLRRNARAGKEISLFVREEKG